LSRRADSYRTGAVSSNLSNAMLNSEEFFAITACKPNGLVGNYKQSNRKNLYAWHHTFSFTPGLEPGTKNNCLHAVTAAVCPELRMVVKRKRQATT
jgi:hypothetical protein